MIRWWVELWDRREPGTVLALVRAGVGLVLLADFLVMARIELWVPLFGPASLGGMSVADQGAWAAPWFVAFGGSATSVWALWALVTGSAATLTLGLFSRTSAAVLMLALAQTALINPDADRGIDTMLRNVLFILAFSECGAVWSLDALRRTGRFAGDGQPVPSWPRYLLVLQIVVMYFTAGVQKYAQHWWPWGDYSALYVILQDWAVARFRFDWIAHQPFYAFTQLSTLVTMVWQWTYPVVLVHYFPPRGAPGAFRRTFDRFHLHWLWIVIGAIFHVLIGATMNLGIFPWGMMVLYPAFLHPDELVALGARLRRTGQ